MAINLDAIQARADAATPGPWEWSGGGGPRVRIPGVRDLCRWHEFDSPTVADAQFVAFARTDVPALVAELRAAREVAERAERFIAIHPTRQTARDEAEAYLINSIWSYKHIAGEVSGS